MSVLPLFFAAALVFLVMAGILRALRLPVEWTGYATFGVLVVAVYA